MATPVAHFCPLCGAEHAEDAQFCASCGHPFASPPEAEQVTEVRPPTPLTNPPPPPPAPAAPNAGDGRQRWIWIAAAAGALAVAAVAVALVLALGGDNGSEPARTAAPGYPTRLAALLEPMGQANDRLSVTLGQLTPGASISAVRGARRTAAAITAETRRALPLLPAPVDETLATDTTLALRAEQTMLRAIAAAISTPSERTASALAAPGQAAREVWARVGGQVPGAGGRIAGLDRLAAWARAAAGGGTSAPGAVNRNGANCGGYQGIFSVTATLTDCTTALRIAVAVVNQGNTGNWSCRSTGDPASGADRWTCSNPSGAIITFSVYPDGGPTDQPQGTPDDVVPDDTGTPQQDTPQQETPGQDTPQQDTPSDVVPDDGSAG